MFKIILDQIAFRKIDISEYAKLSSAGVWLLFLFVSISTSYTPETTLGYWALSSIFGALGVYVMYLFLAFWFKKRGLWDGNGNMFGLFITSSAIDILFIPALMIHPALAGLFFIISLTIGINAIRGALNIKISQTLIAILIGLIVAVIVMIPLSIIMEIIAPVLGIELPPVPEM